MHNMDWNRELKRYILWFLLLHCVKVADELTCQEVDIVRD